MTAAGSRRGQPPALAAYGLDQVGAELAAHPPQQYVQRIRIGVVTAIEHMFAQAVAADHLAAVVDEVAQQAEFLRAQRQRLAIQVEAPGIDVQLQRTALQPWTGMAVA